MAYLNIINDNLEIYDMNNISLIMRKFGIEIGKFDINELVLEYQKKDTLNENERNKLISSYSHIVEKFKDKSGYRSDVVCFYPEFEHLDFILKKFSPIHFHYENEYWYFVDGEAKFGFLGTDGTKFEVVVQKGEYIQVPEGLWQWFELTDKRRMKSMRFFYSTNSIPLRSAIKV
ncbi:cupin domain-containing protein [Priestia sp. JSM ZJ58]|uniref:cupin domain-containing protein n=1 Tax=Priestia sp. JSM ZJ58 TaxID=3376189 RepID=UPI0037A4E89C